MDNWDATVIRQLTMQRHTEEIAQGLAAQRREAELGAQPAARTRRVARFVVAALFAGTLALGFAGPTAGADSDAEQPIRGDFCYAPKYGGPALIFPRCLPHPLPVAPGQVAI